MVKYKFKFQLPFCIIFIVILFHVVSTSSNNFLKCCLIFRNNTTKSNKQTCQHENTKSIYKYIYNDIISFLLLVINTFDNGKFLCVVPTNLYNVGTVVDKTVFVITEVVENNIHKYFEKKI